MCTAVIVSACMYDPLFKANKFNLHSLCQTVHRVTWIQSNTKFGWIRSRWWVYYSCM